MLGFDEYEWPPAAPTGNGGLLTDLRAFFDRLDTNPKVPNGTQRSCLPSAAACQRPTLEWQLT